MAQRRKAKKKPSPKKHPKRAAPKKSKAKKPQRRHSTVALKGLTPTEVEAFRKREIAQRKVEAKAKDDWLRETGQKPGRPKGSERLLREAERAQRHLEVKEQRRERKRRAARAKSKSGRYAKIPKNAPVTRKYTRQGVTKSLLRVRGTGTWQRIVDTLNALPRGVSTYVQLGAGYGAHAPWVGSRLTTPQEAAGWLESIGLKYQSKIFKGAKPADLFIEVVAYRKGGKLDLGKTWETAEHIDEGDEE